jgi:PAS domain S-box-containing protein
MAVLDEGVSRAYVSPQIEKILGFTQEEWLEDPVRWYRQIHPEDRGRWSVEAAQLFLTGQPLRSVYRVMARDSSVIWFHCQAKMVRTDDGRPWFVHGVGFDVTDLKRAEIELKEAHDELEDRVRQRTAELAKANADLALRAEELTRANAELERFAYSASHDLQEPVRNVAIFGGLLREQYHGKLDPQAEMYLRFVTEGAERMELMVRDLLAYSRVASGHAEGAGQPVDANVALAELLESLQMGILESRATITHDLLPVVRLAKSHLQQVLQNLILNALKYRSGMPPQIHISAQTGDGCWRFAVSDNGIGIAPEYHEHIFGMFKRLHGADQYPGTGIGLAICKRIVEGYGGRIWVESECGRGATFLFTVPHTAAIPLSGPGCPAASPQRDGAPAEWPSATPLRARRTSSM